MHFSLVLLHLAGAVMLLLYAVHMVRMGVETLGRDRLRRVIGAARSGHVRAAAGGTVLAVLLQSSTAVALLAAGFAASGLLAVPTGLALMLGADLGSAIAARILSFDLAWLIPLLLFVGGVLHLKIRSPKAHEAGRILLGIGFVLLSLSMVATASGPLREAKMLPAISAYLADDYVTAFLIGALFTWAIHSSVAAVLMLAAFAAQGLLGLAAVGPMVLGANLGGGLIAFWLTRGTPPAAQRVAIGNLIFRAGAALVMLAVFEAGFVPLADLGFGGGDAAAVVNFHLLFNAGLLLLGLPLVGLMARLTESLMPDPPPSALDNPNAQGISVLDRSVVDRPNLALASVTRELLRMGDLVERMLRPLMDLLTSDDRPAIARARKIDKEVNRAHTNIKLYLAEVSRGRMTEDQARRSAELTDFAINLEHAGDIISKLLLPLADERAVKNWSFSGEGLAELTELHARLLDNVHLAMNVLISQDRASARQLVAEKENMRDMARRSQDQHLLRLQQGTPASIETSSMHLEIARGLKEMNSLLVTVAYPLLSRSGELLESRLAVRSDP